MDSPPGNAARIRAVEGIPGCDRFFEGEGIDGALEIVPAANANLYEVVHMQLEPAREIEPRIARERGR